MNESKSGRLPQVLLWFFMVFAFGSAFSIALSQFALAISVLTFVIVAVREKYQPFVRPLRWFYLAVCAYTAWMIFTALVDGTPLKSLNNIREEWLFLLIPVAIYLIRKQKNLDKLVTVLSVSVILVMMYTTYVLWGQLGLHWDDGLKIAANGSIRMQGNFSHSLTFGNYSATVALFLLAYRFAGKCDLSGWSSKLVVLGGMAGVLSTVMSNGRAPLLALLVGLVLLLFFLRRKYLLVGLCLLLVVAGSMFSVKGISDRFGENLDQDMTRDWPGGRTFIWRTTLDIIEEHPVTGVGAGNFFENYRDRVPKSVVAKYWHGHAHNDLLNVTAIAGIPGGLLFAALWGSVLLYLWLGYRRAGPDTRERQLSAAALLGSVVFLVTSVTEATFADEEARQILMFIWAVGLSAWYNTEKQTDITLA